MAADIIKKAIKSEIKEPTSLLCIHVLWLVRFNQYFWNSMIFIRILIVVLF